MPWPTYGEHNSSLCKRCNVRLTDKIYSGETLTATLHGMRRIPLESPYSLIKYSHAPIQINIVWHRSKRLRCLLSTVALADWNKDEEFTHQTAETCKTSLIFVNKKEQTPPNHPQRLSSADHPEEISWNTRLSARRHLPRSLLSQSIPT